MKLTKFKKFSLIELLVVMVITAILLGIVIPTFHKVTKGVSVEMGARQLGAQLKAVREYAITNRRYVALIMNSTNLPSGYQTIAYRPCIINNSTGAWEEWVPGERWEFMPEGARIESMTGFTEDITGIDCSDISGGTIAVNNIPVFAPTGKCEGVNAGGATITVQSGIDTHATEADNSVSINVAGFTGRVSYGNN